MIAKKSVRVLVVVALALLSGCFFLERPFYRDAAISSRGKAICISVKNNIKARHHPPVVTALQVMETKGSETSSLLFVHLPKPNDGTYLITPNKCLPLDGIDLGSMLRPGHGYELSMRGYANGESLSYVYTAHFCLDDRTQPATVRQVPDRFKHGERDWSLCGMPAAGAR